MKKLVLVAICLFVLGGFVNAQKFKPSPDFLSGQTEVNVILDYSKVVYDGDSQTKYYKGKSKSWIEEWEGKRRDANWASFCKDLNAEIEKSSTTVGEHSDAQYTILVDVLDCDFGAYAGPMSVPAKLTCTVRIVKTGTTQTLASVTMKVKQSSFTTIATPVDFDRMFLAFGEMGEKVGKMLSKILK